MQTPDASPDVGHRLASVALTLFTEHGYDSVTTSQIATAAGVSQRTFFRYFPNKVSVLFTEQGDETAAFINLLYAQPVNTPTPTALIDAIAAHAEQYPLNTDDVVRARLARTTPSLAEAIRAYETHFESELARWIAQRRQRHVDDFDVRLAAATLVAARRVVVEELTLQEGAPSIVELARSAISTISTPLDD